MEWASFMPEQRICESEYCHAVFFAFNQRAALDERSEV
ncbi:hypothetical protein SAMN05444680_115123 [Variovorax sp. YR216]|nr:hypothetical protein SAMN05444680_115123 [Variovorax sp. YR216]